MCDKIAISAYILKIIERDPFLKLQMRAKEDFNRHQFFPKNKQYVKINPIWTESAPLRFFLHNSKTTGDINKRLSDFNFTPLMDILRILSTTIVVRCCHSNLLFLVCHVIFGLKKQRNLNYFQDNYLFKLKFGTWGYF